MPFHYYSVLFHGLLSLGKKYIVDVWEIQKHRLYDSGSGPGQQLHPQSSPGDLAVGLKGRGMVSSVRMVRNGKLGHSCVRVTKGRHYDSQVRDHVIVHLGLNLSSFDRNCGCMVDGGNAMAAI